MQMQHNVASALGHQYDSQQLTDLPKMQEEDDQAAHSISVLPVGCTAASLFILGLDPTALSAYAELHSVATVRGDRCQVCQ